MLVTGGAAGLGAAIGSAGAEAGYRVGLYDLDAAAVEATAASIDSVVGLVGSTTDPDAIEAALDDFGPVDVLVANAGIVRFGPLVDLAVEDWRQVVDVNLTGTFLTARAVARRMLTAAGGAIVNISSMNGVAAGPNSGAYGPTKAAVGLLTEQMALEWAPSIRVNAVAPGLIDAGMSEQVYADPATRAAREGRVPLGRLGVADDIARAVLWLGSDEAAYVTGQTLVVDGGVTGSIITHLPRPRDVDGVGHESP
jgi:NAD(P)-dependent dehydrogenase (short-subunit alcohol dehydrogenase family)